LTKSANPSDVQQLFGERVRARRLSLALAQTDVAERTGIAQTELSRIELGRVNVTMRTMIRLADALACEVPDLLPETLAAWLRSD